jgi:hypothetical protein
LTLRNQSLVVAFTVLINSNRFEAFGMMQAWSSWKRFPDAQSGEHVEAPIGPGVYEVRHCMSGRLLAFGHAGNVAHAISELKVNGGAGPIARLFRRQPLVSRVADLEYRTCAAATRADAKITAQRLMGLRQTAWRRRMDLGWAARHPG